MNYYKTKEISVKVPSTDEANSTRHRLARGMKNFIIPKLI